MPEAWPLGAAPGLAEPAQPASNNRTAAQLRIVIRLPLRLPSDGTMPAHGSGITRHWEGRLGPNESATIRAVLFQGDRRVSVERGERHAREPARICPGAVGQLQ